MRLIATEDERFYQHSGIDVKGTARAILFLGTKGGASTITQQLAKNHAWNRVQKILSEESLKRLKSGSSPSNLKGISQKKKSLAFT